MLEDCAGQPVHEGDFIVFATKTEAPSLKFGYIESIKEVKSKTVSHIGTFKEYKIKVNWTDPYGNPVNKTVFRKDNDGEYRYQDTGKRNSSTLTATTYVGPDRTSLKEHRLMVMQPI